MKRQILCCFLLSSLEEAENDFQAENIPEAMEVDTVPDATAKEERIAMLEAELELEKQKISKPTKSADLRKIWCSTIL